MTYAGLGVFGLISLGVGLNDLRLAVLSLSPSFLISCALPLTMAGGFIYVILALRQRWNWARYAAASFWLLCLIWTASAIVRNGMHPEPAPGPLRYSNADQLAGARFTALVLPWVVAVVELTAVYCLKRKVSVVKQFARPGNSTLEPWKW